MKELLALISNLSPNSASFVTDLENLKALSAKLAIDPFQLGLINVNVNTTDKQAQAQGQVQFQAQLQAQAELQAQLQAQLQEQKQKQEQIIKLVESYRCRCTKR